MLKQERVSPLKLQDTIAKNILCMLQHKDMTEVGGVSTEVGGVGKPGPQVPSARLDLPAAEKRD